MRPNLRSPAALRVAFFAQWSKTSWQFCLALFLAAVTHFESLILVSWYGMVVGLAVAVTGGRVGQWIDTSPNRRLTVARWLIGGSCRPPRHRLFYVLLSASDVTEFVELLSARIVSPTPLLGDE